MAGKGNPGPAKDCEPKVGAVNTGNMGKGRPKGIPNKATTLAREAIAQFVDGNTDRLQGWLDAIAEREGPLAAFRCLMDVMEYHVPKLNRTEYSGVDGGPVEHEVKIVVNAVRALNE